MIHVKDSLLSMGKAWCLDFSKNHGITKTKAQLVVWKSLDET